MPLHDAVLEVEPLDVANSRGFDSFRETKARPANVAALRAVEADEKELVLDAQVRRLRGWVGERVA